MEDLITGGSALAVMAMMERMIRVMKADNEKTRTAVRKGAKQCRRATYQLRETLVPVLVRLEERSAKEG